MRPVPRASPYVLIVVAVAAAYANALGASFQFDDWNVIVDEPRVRSLAAWWASIPGIRPLLKLTYALNFELGVAPVGFHAVNVAIHAANASLLFALLHRRAPRWVAMAAALIFALHPVQTEAVTYVSGRSSSLAALFALASLLAWFEGRGRIARRLSPAFFACGLLVKETIAVLPLALVGRGTATETRTGFRLLSPFLFVLAAAAAAALLSPMYLHLFGTSIATRSMGTNLLTQAHGVTYLMGQLVRLDRLNADPALPVIASWSWQTAAEVALIAALVTLGFALLKKRPEIAYGILWFFLWLLPTNSILPRFDVANDRQLYLALAGPAWLAAYGLGTLAKSRGGVFPIGAALLLVIGLGTATHLRNRVYADEITFWDDVATKSPENGRSFNNLGYALALAGRTDEADQAFRRALAIDPNDVRAAVNLRLLREGGLPGRARRP